MTAPAARRGFSAEAVAELVRQRDEPDWMRQRRLDAWQTYERLPITTRQDEEWRRTDLRNLKLDEVAPFANGHNGRSPRGTLLPEAERQEQLGGFLGLRDGHPVENRLDESLRVRGVISTDLATAVRELGDL